jgi:hypothetical protein
MLMGHKRIKVDIIIPWVEGAADVAEGDKDLVGPADDREMI